MKRKAHIELININQSTHLGLRLRTSLGVPWGLVNEEHVPGVGELAHRAIASVTVDPRKLERLPGAGLLMTTVKVEIAFRAELAHGLVGSQPHLAVKELLAFGASKLKKTV